MGGGAMTLMGTNSPDNFDQIGRFNVTTDSGDEFQGVLFSQANPPSGQFARNETYDPANIDGTQYVVTAESIEEQRNRSRSSRSRPPTAKAGIT